MVSESLPGYIGKVTSIDIFEDQERLFLLNTPLVCLTYEAMERTREAPLVAVGDPEDDPPPHFT